MRALITAWVLAGCGGMQWHDPPMQAAFLTATYLDYQQTKIITNNCNETNPIIRPCGDGVLGVTPYFALAAIAHTAVVAIIPKGKWRTAFQAISIGVESTTVYTNRLGGVPIRWW